MSQSLSSLLEVSIDFDRSHLFFPTLISVLIGVMLVWIVVVNRHTLVAKLKGEQGGFAFWEPDADKFRLFATLVLVVAYFYLMDVVGQLFPNTGFGFLLTSIPFMFLLSIVYVHGITRRVLVVITLNSLIAPCAAWYLLGQLFGITLP